MNVPTRAFPIALALATAAILGACGGGAPPATNPEPTAQPAARDTAAERIAREQQESARRDAEAAAARQRAIDDSIANARNAEEAARAASDALRMTVTTVINFEFNKSDLRDDAKAALDAKIPILLANANVTVRVSGHADSRGSTEYNLALGQKRAAAAKRYLMDRGVAEARIETTSFGEERPMCSEEAEGCWAQNRRDEFEITAGGPMLIRPR